MNVSHDNPVVEGKTWRILLVEDDEATRESALLKFHKEGFDVIAKEDGHEAMEYLKGDHAFDAMLLDLRMPKSDGFQFLELKQNDPKLANIPVIVFTNLNQREHIERAVRLGAKGYLIKAHHSIQQIVHEIRACLQDGACKIDTY